MSSIWNTCLSKLENEIPSNEFSTWIRPLQAVEKGDTLKLLAPNRFIIDHVKQHFISKIEDAVYEFSNGTLILQFEIGSKKTTPLTQPKQQRKLAQKVKSKRSTFLNNAFTFDNFVEGKSNQLARAASIQVSENIGKAYNPLFHYGSSGLGKTHLMNAIGNKAIEKNPWQMLFISTLKNSYKTWYRLFNTIPLMLLQTTIEALRSC